MFGFLNIYKPKGITSHDVVSVLRRVTKIKQIGHTGTLDPFAEGVLPICIGKATRLIEYLDDDKAYIATIKFGKSTTTYDLEGEVVKTSDIKVIKETLEKCLDNFRGEIEQIPPIYSAIKVNGKKLYDYARSGESVEIKSRRVTIFKLELLDFDEKSQTAELLIECSKGTYIRSIANDLGEILGAYGHLIKLVRTKAGSFNLETSVKLEDLTSLEVVKNNLKYPLEYLNLPIYEVSESQKIDIGHGKALLIDANDGQVVFTNSEKIVAVATVNNNVAKMNKVFI